MHTYFCIIYCFHLLYTCPVPGDWLFQSIIASPAPAEVNGWCHFLFHRFWVSRLVSSPFLIYLLLSVCAQRLILSLFSSLSVLAAPLHFDLHV